MKEMNTRYYQVNPEANDYKGGTLSVGFAYPQTMTIKEILEKWFDDEIGDGFKFKYDGTEFVIDKKQIRSVQKFHRSDYGDGEYEDLFEWIDTDNLDEVVEITEYVYVATISETITPCDSEKEENNSDDDKCEYLLPQHNCAVLPNGWSYGSYAREVRCCPVCGGKGIVDNGFYNHTGNIWVTSTTAPEQCRSCNGKGYVEI